MANASYPRLGVIGAGRVGGALARALHSRGYRIVAVWSRTRSHAEDLAHSVAAQVATNPAQVASTADLTLLAVSDDAIAPLVAAVAEDGCWQPGRAAVHLSGAHGTAILAPAAAQGAQVGALHPLQTIPDGRAPIPPGTSFAIEALEPLLATLRAMVEALSGYPLALSPADRPLYHAAAVMTANYAVTLMAQAVALLERCGAAPDRALEALLPLLRGTVENLDRLGLPDALTGPIARGDTGTLRAHLEALELHTPTVAALYRALGAATLPLAAGRLPQARVAEMAEIFTASSDRSQVSDSKF